MIQRNKAKYKNRLALQQLHYEQENQILQIELEAEKRIKQEQEEKNILETQFHQKESEIAGQAYSIAKQTKTFEKIQNILNTNTDIKSLKSKINRLVQKNLKYQNEWNEFEINLNKSNEKFIAKLHQEFENLTTKDIKLSIYLKLQLSTKEIAQLMGITPRGVEVHRYRLRKKLQLQSEDNISAFLVEFNATT